MIPYLEKVPHDVLQHIAFLSSSSSVLGPPSDLLQLLSTSSSIYHSLCVQGSPHLYAKLYRTKFDLGAHRRRFSIELTNSSLAAEFVQRCRALQRIRRHKFSGESLRQDLWTILWMILESDGLNEAQLSIAGFSSFILAFIRCNLCEDRNSHVEGPSLTEIKSLALWLFYLTLSREEISRQVIDTRDEVLILLRPFTVSRPRAMSYLTAPSQPSSTKAILRSKWAWYSHAKGHIDDRGNARYPVMYLSRRCTPVCPDASSAAIALTFALKEMTSLELPSHLPATRGIAIASQRFGPTIEDYHTAACYRTPLFADACPDVTLISESVCESLDSSRSMKVDQDYYRMFASSDSLNINGHEVHSYTPGLLTGLWEGTYMVSPLNSPPLPTPCVPDFLCQHPMQCYLTEHFCFSPHVPLPIGDIESGDISLERNLSPGRLVDSEDGFEISSRKFQYQKFVPTSERRPCWRDPTHALDMVITGQTLQEHDDAWGGFRFAGKVCRDGVIVLKREPKDGGENGLGSWVFEGRVHFGSSFVGTWRSSSASDRSGISGIFSLRKRGGT